MMILDLSLEIKQNLRKKKSTGERLNDVIS